MDNKQTQLKPRKCFRCVSEDHPIAKCSKPPKENEKQKKQVRLSERGNHASRKECDNENNNNDHQIYVFMAQMSDNDEIPNRDFGDSLQLTNWVLDSGATCHMTPQVSDFISGFLEDRDKHIEVSDRHHVTAKQKGQV